LNRKLKSILVVLQALLCIAPRQRLSANEALSFPYFTKSFVRGCVPVS
jgi:hypothetical protein